MSLPSAIASAYAPWKTSPAPSVSTASIAGAGTWNAPSRVSHHDPASPQVTAHARAPSRIDDQARASASRRAVASAPADSEAHRAARERVDDVRVGDVGVEHRRDARVVRGVEQRDRAGGPAYVGEHGARGAH